MRFTLGSARVFLPPIVQVRAVQVPIVMQSLGSECEEACLQRRSPPFTPSPTFVHVHTPTGFSVDAESSYTSTAVRDYDYELEHFQN